MVGHRQFLKVVLSKLRSHLDFLSLVFQSEPDFDYFRSREFFIAHDSACNAPMNDVTLLEQPKSLVNRKALLEQRFKVKQLKEGLRAAVKQDPNYLKRWTGSKGDKQRLPAVELHMYPADPTNASAEWKVLLVPRVREVFGKTVFPMS